LYTILSVYSILKPPKSGNCIIGNNKPMQSLVTFESIKQIYHEPEKYKSLLQTVQEKLDFAIEFED